MIGHLDQLAERSSLRRIRLKTAAAWPRAVAFYDRLGFSRVGVDGGNLVLEREVAQASGLSAREGEDAPG